MKILSENIDYKKLVSDILEYSKTFTKDIKEKGFENFSIFDFYNYVNNLPYISDGKNNEMLARPKYTLDINYKINRDCDDKCLILTSFFELKGIKYRVIVSGRKNKVHHIYPEIFIPKLNRWLKIDATYPKINKLGEGLFPEKKREIYYKFT